MKTTRKLLSVLLAVLLLALTMAVAAVPAQAYSTIQFGNYPQTKVSETMALKAAADDAAWHSYDYYSGNSASDYMQYAVFFSGGVKYRAVKFSEYRPYSTSVTFDSGYSHQADNGYSKYKTYYFKYEPLVWRVLDASSGLVMCNSIIDAQAYQNVVRQSGNDYYIGNSSTYANNYVSSTIRKWLNNDFYNTAFSDTQKAKIQSTAINNDAGGSGNSQFNSASTTDKIYLLSYSEATSSNYSLSTVANRQSVGTAYALCQGLSVNLDGYSTWRLRSAGRYSDCVCGVNGDGTLYTNHSVTYTCYGIRPVCRLTSLSNDTSQSDIYTVNLATFPGQGGTATGGGSYGKGETVTLKAVPNAGYKFSGWFHRSGTLLSENTTASFTMGNNDVYLQARFEALPTHTVTVMATPSAGGTVSGGGTYAEGATVTVKAVPNTGDEFSGRFHPGGALFSGNPSTSFEVGTNNVTLQARFTIASTYTITVTTSPSAGGTVTGGGTFPEGSSTKLVATPNEGWHFVGFIDETGERWGNLSPTITVTGNRTFTAKFVNVAAMPTVKNSTDTLNDGDWYFDKDALIAAFAQGFHLTTEEASEMLADVAIAKYDPQSGIVVYMDASGDVDGAIVALPEGDGDVVYDLYKAGIKQYHASGNSGGSSGQSANLCKWCGKTHEGFFQKIIGFFHNIMAKIFGAKY